MVATMAQRRRAATARLQHNTRVVGVDRWLLWTTLALLVIGLVSVYTASAHQALRETGSSLSILIKQILAAGVGLGLMGLCSRINFAFWRRTALGWGALSVVLLLITMVAGTTANGSERWIPLPFGFQFQPSDLAKVAAIALVAQATSQPRLLNFVTALNLALVGGMILLIYQQPNLSVSMILGFVTFAMVFVAGLPWYLAVGLPPFALYGIWQKITQTEYQMRRITGWLNPWADPQDTGYNLIQSYYAVGSGGLFGVGLGHSIQKLYYLPFQHTDFIFSVICEELGFLGALIIIGLFALLAWRGFAIAINCPSRFGQMLAFGLTAALTIQALINISVTIGLMPVTGVTLPLISYGGTSMVITLGMIGILMNISRYRLHVEMTDYGVWDD